jgi:putative ABC transport system permease protein
MKLRTLILRSLRFHWRSQLGVLLGAAIGSAALIGALVVGDSVRGSLRDLALQRLGWVDAAMAPAERFFSADLDQRLILQGQKPLADISICLRLPAVLSRQDGEARANGVQVLGVRPDFWNPNAPDALKSIPKQSVVLNEALAGRLRAKVGDDVVMRLHKPSALSREVPITPQNDSSIALRLKVHAIARAEDLGNFNLQASQTPPLNAFVHFSDLADAAGVSNRANVVLFGLSRIKQMNPRKLAREFWPAESLPNADRFLVEAFNIASGEIRRQISDGPRSEISAAVMQRTLLRSKVLGDLELDLHPLTNASAIELRTRRIFLDPPAVKAALASNAPQPILTYLVNQLRSGTNMVPYSMVTAAGAPWTPPDLRDDEVVINQWLADDLKLKPGDTLELAYFLPESGARLMERTNKFKVRSVVPLAGIHDDRTLMPEFPGVAKAESTSEWDAGFPLVHKIRDQDEEYWKKHRGTPKAFVSLAAGQSMWSNRFGNLTAIRYAVPPGQDAGTFRTNLESTLLRSIDPTSLGLRFEPVRAQALAASSQSQDFGGLFLGFSFFLILAALILMALLFQFGLEQRLTEIGTMLALGFTPSRVRRLFLFEGISIAFLGGALGVIGGLGYAQAMLAGLTTIWRDAVGTSALRFHVTPLSLGIGLFASVLVCAITIWFVLRKQARRPARELLSEGGELLVHNSKFKVQSSKALWVALSSTMGAVGLIGWALASGASSSAGTFFGAGSLLLIAGLAGVSVLLTMLDQSDWSRRLTVPALGVRGCTRRRSRTLASVALLACGSFLIVAVGANRLDAGRDATKRSSGTGGFALFGEATLPVLRDLNTTEGREFYNLDEDAMTGVSVVPFRVRDGDEASCLNLNRAQNPRLLGVKPELLAERGAFTFAKLADGVTPEKPWLALKRGEFYPKKGQPLAGDEVAAIGDAQSIQWALGKKIGDTINYTDERGRSFKVKIVGAVANSILQGSLIIDEAAFVERFPGEAGHRMFLMDVTSKDAASVTNVSATLSRALQDVGLELTSTTQRMAAFNAVQNTYLNTFQVLGGLGLLLGSAGLGVVVLRNVLERRGELGLLRAVGFRRRSLRWLVLSEHGGILAVGLAVGMISALASILPVLLAPGAELHVWALGITLGGVLSMGLLATWLATSLALKGELLQALRSE